MKVKYINNDSSWFFENWQVYNVFAIELSANKNFYYIDNWISKYIYWWNTSDFEIVDSNISTHWKFWINQFWDHVIWPEEVYKMEYFWSNYLEDTSEYQKVIDKYYGIARNELFNSVPDWISEQEKQRRQEAGWEFIDSENK